MSWSFQSDRMSLRNTTWTSGCPGFPTPWRNNAGSGLSAGIGLVCTQQSRGPGNSKGASEVGAETACRVWGGVLLHLAYGSHPKIDPPNTIFRLAVLEVL